MHPGCLEGLRFRLFDRLARAIPASVSVRHRGLLMRVPLDSMVGRTLLRGGLFEHAEFTWMTEFLRPGTC